MLGVYVDRDEQVHLITLERPFNLHTSRWESGRGIVSCTRVGPEEHNAIGLFDTPEPGKTSTMIQQDSRTERDGSCELLCCGFVTTLACWQTAGLGSFHDNLQDTATSSCFEHPTHQGRKCVPSTTKHCSDGELEREVGVLGR